MNTYFQRNRERLEEQAKQYYYGNNKVSLNEQARNRYRELSNEEKNIKRESGRNIRQNMPSKSKRRLKEYQKTHRKTKNSKSEILFFLSLHSLKWKKNLIFGEGSVNKNLCYKRKLPINIDKADIRKIIVSSKDSYAKK